MFWQQKVEAEWKIVMFEGEKMKNKNSLLMGLKKKINFSVRIFLIIYASFVFNANICIAQKLISISFMEKSKNSLTVFLKDSKSGEIVKYGVVSFKIHNVDSLFMGQIDTANGSVSLPFIKDSCLISISINALPYHPKEIADFYCLLNCKQTVTVYLDVLTRKEIRKVRTHSP